MAKPEDDKDACVMPHAAGMLPGPPPHTHTPPVVQSHFAPSSPLHPCWGCHRPRRAPRHLPPHPKWTELPHSPPTGEAPPHPGPGRRAAAMPPRQQRGWHPSAPAQLGPAPWPLPRGTRPDLARPPQG